MIFVHEAGHALAAFTLGLRLDVIAVWGIGYDFKARRFGVQTFPGTRKPGGFVRFGSKGTVITRRANGLVSASGNIANILSALLVSALLPADPNTILYQVMNRFAVLSMASGVINFVPFADNDGRHLWNAIKGNRTRRR